jgi:putative sigma-54 modulation protein|eukprot:g1208.t1 g1208   contig10:1606326-1607423(-)
MRTSSFVLLSVLASTTAFSPVPSITTRAAINSGLQMTVKAPIVVTGDNIDLTPALSDYVNSKIEKTVGKLPLAVSHCDVYLTVNKNPKVEDAHTAEVVTTLKGTTFRVAESSPDMYASIDLVAARLARKLRKYKERRLDGYHGGPNMGENIAEVLNAIEVDESEDGAEEESYIDPDQAVVTKVKSFDLSTPISIKEAIFALDYIDHDFYVFRDEETNEVSVVYKRNAGGVGLIQPEQ